MNSWPLPSSLANGPVTSASESTRFGPIPVRDSRLREIARRKKAVDRKPDSRGDAIEIDCGIAWIASTKQKLAGVIGGNARKETQDIGGAID